MYFEKYLVSKTQENKKMLDFFFCYKFHSACPFVFVLRVLFRTYHITTSTFLLDKMDSMDTCFFGVGRGGTLI